MIAHSGPSEHRGSNSADLTVFKQEFRSNFSTDCRTTTLPTLVLREVRTVDRPA